MVIIEGFIFCALDEFHWLQLQIVLPLPKQIESFLVLLGVNLKMCLLIPRKKIYFV